MFIQASKSDEGRKDLNGIICYHCCTKGNYAWYFLKKGETNQIHTTFTALENSDKYVIKCLFHQILSGVSSQDWPQFNNENTMDPITNVSYLTCRDQQQISQIWIT